MVDPPSGHGGDAQKLMGVLADAGESGPKHLRERHRKTSALAARREEFLGEERIALGAFPDGRRDTRLDVGAKDRGKLAHDLVPIESCELDAVDPRDPFDLCQPAQQWMTTVELVAPEGRDEQQPLVADVSNEEGQELARRVVGPVQVLDYEHDRPLCSESPKQVEERLVQAASCPFGSQLGGVHRTNGCRARELERRSDRGDRVASGGRPSLGGAVTVGLLERADQWTDRLDDRAERE